ncbi:alpha/beta fold hydrolase [Verrucomicrobium spinosum]|uniref:alpha/beta fold hydrolase n=1 Tax=Verrucomicrobium spinosum TaxID=2736 RepID=UPI000174494F|nr:alpha/beta hydrolase [Verrucomicrobium spinosum]
MKHLAFYLLALTGGLALPAAAFDRVLPPPAKEIPSDLQASLQQELAAVSREFESVRGHNRAADADIFLKAVRYALEFGEWYDKKPEDGVKKAQDQLAEARRRIEGLKNDTTPWLEGAGSKVLGFYSNIDDSPQPYGVDIPEGLEWGRGKKAVPLWIWLHGRGDTATDLHFIAGRMRSKGGEFRPKNAIVVHPFGRFCNGYKSAGETDVFECRSDALKRFNGDPLRVALMGFSMGGAGAWHMGAHYADQWACVHAGAGFADVQRYLNRVPGKKPAGFSAPWYEQTLWGVYDVPDYARNFFNVPLVAYSGENDAQRDTAEYMAEVLAGQGFQLQHLIGPGMGHKYDPAVRDQVAAIVEKAVAAGRNLQPDQVILQFRSARYARMHWLQVVQVKEPMLDTRVEARLDEVGHTITVTTKNVESFEMLVPWKTSGPTRTVVIDGASSTFAETRAFQAGRGQTQYYLLTKQPDGSWNLSGKSRADRAMVKSGGTCIEDALLNRFVIVLPDKPGRSPEVDAWVKAESEHFIRRWKELMRGDPLVAKASDVGQSLATRENLILWGDDLSNSCIAQRLSGLPVKWSGGDVTVGGNRFSSGSHVPVLIYPEVPSAPGQGMVVINSGLTFREAHDRTNSLQNPKLPDWAVIDITTPPDAERAGNVVDAGFFDASWKVAPRNP